MNALEPSSVKNLWVKRRACLSCTSAKVKCTFASLSTESCERCERLGKGCIYAEPSSETRRNRREASSARRLEEKVELLSTQVAALTQHIQSTSFEGQRSTRPVTKILGSSFSSSHDRISESHLASSEFLSGSGGGYKDSLANVALNDLGGLAAADRRLQTFRREFVHYFPFVVVPPTVSFEALQYDNPFLFLCIMAVTSFEDPKLQRRLGQKVKKHICDHIVMGLEVSMDLLQGLLIFVNWYQYFCLPGKHQYFLMLQLCINLCHELRLDSNEKGKRGLDEAQTQGKAQNPAEMRALLGTYYLSSQLSMVLRKRTMVHYTSYMEDCCTSLARLRDAPSDQLIAPFVEIQVLQRKIGNAFCYHDISTCDIRGERALQITVDSFFRELDGLKTTVGSRDRNTILVQHLRFLEVWILEVALHNELWQSPFVPARLRFEETIHSTQLSMQRTNMMWQLVAATVSFHDWCLSVENAELLHFPFSWWTEHSYVVIVQVKAIFPNHGNVVTGKVPITESLEVEFRRAADQEFMIPHMLDLYIRKLATITTQLVDDDGNRDMAYYYGVLLKSIQSGYESRIKAETRPTPVQFESQQKESSLSQRLQPEFGNMDLLGSMPPTVSANRVELETGDSHIFPANQLDLQFDLAQPGFDDFVWDTMMDDFSFFVPNNGPSL